MASRFLVTPVKLGALSTACVLIPSACRLEKEEKADERARYHAALEDKRDRDLERLRAVWAYGTGQQPKFPTSAWPKVQPSEEDLPALRAALEACRASPGAGSGAGSGDVAADAEAAGDSLRCADLEFDLGTALLGLHWDGDAQAYGANIYHDLATRGHRDGMVGYGGCLSHGRGVPQEDPAAAAMWWTRAAAPTAPPRASSSSSTPSSSSSSWRHPQACYELGVATYLGSGVPESEAAAYALFAAAAEASCADGDCHPAALYMVGDCLLEGIGATRDGAAALTALHKAGDHGHRGARSRLLALLESGGGGGGGYEGKFTDASRQSFRRRRTTQRTNAG